MKKIIIYILMMCALLGVVSASSFTRVSSAATVTPSSSFTITYTATKVDAEWFVNWHDEVTGGCTPTSYENFLARQAGDAETQTKIVTFTAPSSGTCTFQNGYYQFATESLMTLSPLSIGISSGCTSPSECTSPPVCKLSAGATCTAGVCSYPNAPSTTSCTGGTCDGSGSCISSCTPSWTYTTWSPSICPSSCTQTRTATDSNNCGTTSGREAISYTCTGGDCVAVATACEFYQTEKTDGTCKIATWVYLVIGFMFFMVVFKNM